MKKAQRQQGFTLLEVMLVVLLMGLMAAAVTLSIGSGGQQQVLNREAQRFMATTEALQDEAVLSGGFFGIVVEEQKYHYVMLKEGKWRPIEQDNLLSERQLPAGIVTDLEVEGLPLEQDEQQQSWFGEPFIEADAAERKKFPEPQIMLLPSGEMTGFKLRFIAAGDEGLPLEKLVSGNSLGRMVLGEFDELS
ncbi:type II secretion system minor pseudopilin GspH [Shewanella avicenniae]|uniref:Type II secretion system protein H n=1 Tax=Shewanella avicenniae TaxID=2814294 RepID=A0ABX7QQG6_9GAMM|nr:type II secretion system minor pseudopilin GspH [Shewanella avicenniae]QSX33514.1 type II secretion system minor pseudopilin GspH [Shewanella avicenniae]